MTATDSSKTFQKNGAYYVEKPEEIDAVRGYLTRERLTAEVVSVRAHPGADVTSVVRVRRA